MQRFLVCCATVLFLAGQTGDAERILGLFPFPGRSHFIVFSPLLEELAKRGHNVTVVTAFPRKTPLKNYNDVPIDDFFYSQGNQKINMYESHKMSMYLFMFMMRSLSIELCEHFLNEPGVKNLIQNEDEHFDLVIYEPFYSECVYGIVHKMKAPFIQIFSNTMPVWAGDGVGNPFFFSYIPDPMLEFSDHMSFKERMVNTITDLIFVLERNWITMPKMEYLMRKYFPDPTLPSIHEIETNASFLLLNSHVAFNYPRPFTPNTAEVGGMHLKEPKKLPKDLQTLLDEANEGVIYFSLGSNIRSADMPEEMRDNFLTVFSRLKQKVLWKWEIDELPGAPKNLHLSKWFPQNDILAHPNVKAFITHGGLLSTQEAVNYGVPIIAIPFWADQKQNALRAVKQGFGIMLDIQNITEQSLDWATNQILTDVRYRDKAKSLSKIFQDQPEKALERAVFWTEYVIRHKGAPHMRSAALKLNIFQYFLLDVIAVLALFAGVLLIVSITICKIIFRRLFSKSKLKRQKIGQKKTN